MRPNVRSFVLCACVLAALVIPFAPGAAASVPGAPTITSAYAGPSRATVMFDAPVDDGGNAVTSYSVACTSSDGGVPGSAAGTESPITVAGLTPDASYTCVVVAFNIDGQSTDSAPSGTLFPWASTAPSAPWITGVSAIPGALVVTVNPSDDGGEPITGYGADCTSDDGGAPGSATDSTSTVTVAGLTSGRWYTCTATVANAIGTSPPSGWWGPFQIPDPPPTGAITGIVTASPPADLTGYCAQATYTYWDNVLASAPIAADGTYTITGLATGEYAVRFTDCTGGGDYLPQWYDGRLARPQGDPSGDGATTVIVDDGQTTNGIDGNLTLGAHVTGTVTDGSGVGLQNICVGALVQFDPAAMTGTSEDGTYDLLVPPGVVNIAFFDCENDHDYVTQFWDHTDTRGDAVPLALVADTTTTGIDATMIAGGSIEGVVTDAVTGDPIENVCVTPSTANIDSGGRTANDGSYRVGPLPPGDYSLSFVDCSDNATYGGTTRSATIVADQTTVLDVELAPELPGSIAGHLTTEFGTPLAGVCIAVLTGFTGEPRFAGPTGPDGAFEVPNLGTGTYFVGFFGCNGDSPADPIPDPLHPGVTYAAQWYSNAPLGVAPDPYGDGAIPVTVLSGQTTVVNECFDACNTSIVITEVVPGDGSITIWFSVNDVNTNQEMSTQALDDFAATCTSSDGGAAGAATGPGSPITVTGLTNGATYACTVSFTDGPTTYAATASTTLVTGSPTGHFAGASGGPGGGALAFTGAANTARLASAAFAMILIGAASVGASRRRRRPRPARTADPA